MIKTLENSIELDALIKKYRFVVLKFSAEWCGPCHALQNELDKEFLPRIKDSNDIAFVKIDTDKLLPILMSMGETSIPVVVVYKDGKRLTFSIPDRKTGVLVPGDKIVGFYKDNVISKILNEIVK